MTQQNSEITPEMDLSLPTTSVKKAWKEENKKKKNKVKNQKPRKKYSLQERIEIWYVSAKITFILSSFIFFLGFFLVSAGFIHRAENNIILPTYIAFVLSFMNYVGFYVFHVKKHTIPFSIKIGICIAAALAGIVFLIPVI